MLQTSRFLFDTCVKFVSLDTNHENRLLNYIYQFSESKGASRAQIRCSLVTDVTYVNTLEPDKQRKALSADIGIEGMRLFVDENSEINHILRLVFSLPDGLPALSVEGKIVWKREGKKTILGLKFIGLHEYDKKRINLYIKSKLLIE